MKIKLTSHVEKDRHVVNTPGSHIQRQPRVYASFEKAAARVRELLGKGAPPTT